MSNRVTLSMIVKNEQRSLERCLASVCKHVDAIQIVDTGSTDDSVAIALKFGAEVLPFGWTDSFSDARNAGLKTISEGWVLWLDADEWFPGDSGKSLRRLAEKKADIVWISRRDIEADGKTISVNQLPRMWRAEPGWRMRRRIHEVLDIQNPAAVRNYHSQAEIHHDGYAFDSKAKTRRNLPLLREDLVELPEEVYVEAKIASSLMDLGDPEAPAALDALEQKVMDHRHQKEAPDPGYSQAILTLIQGAFQGRPITGTTARLALQWFGNAPAVPYRLAELFGRLERHEMAYQAFSTLDRHMASNTVRHDIPYHPEMAGLAFFLNFALCAHRLGDLETARRMYGKTLNLDPENAVARKNLSMIR